MIRHLIVRQPIELQDYQATLAKVDEMMNSDYKNDELWLVQHPIVYTKGFATPEAITKTRNGCDLIPVNRRGGISHHAPGQLACYVNVDLKRLGIGPKMLIEMLEDITFDVLKEYGIKGERFDGIPGAYVDGKKIMLMGLNFTEKRTTFGFAINVSNDLSLFDCINLCGYKELQVTNMQLAAGKTVTIRDVANKITKAFIAKLGYKTHKILNTLM